MLPSDSLAHVIQTAIGPADESIAGDVQFLGDHKPPVEKTNTSQSCKQILISAAVVDTKIYLSIFLYQP